MGAAPGGCRPGCQPRGLGGVLRRLRGWGARARGAPAWSRTLPPSGPGACGCVGSPPPAPGCVSRCHPRTAAALRNLGSAEKEEITRASVCRERKGEPARGASVRGCGGPPGSLPPGGDVMPPPPAAWGHPFARTPSRGLGEEAIGKDSPLPTLATGCSGQVASSGGALGQVQPVTLSLPVHLHPSSQQASPGLCSWVALFWGDFQGARVLTSFPSLPGAICPGIGRKRIGCAFKPGEPCFRAISSTPVVLAEGEGGAGAAPRASPAHATPGQGVAPLKCCSPGTPGGHWTPH